jgi:hypothetical protein
VPAHSQVKGGFCGNPLRPDVKLARGESADEAYLGTAQDRLASAKESAKAAIAVLRQWLREAEDNDDGAGE